ncbi:MAG: RimK/LysX family protein [Burkholderiaceae bacterium]
MVKILLRQLQSIATLLVFQIVPAILSPVAVKINHARNFGKPLADKTVVGYLEHAWFAGNKISFEAKLDTGAKSCSINSARSERFERDGCGS